MQSASTDATGGIALIQRRRKACADGILSRMSQPSDLFEELLGAPDRDRCPGTAPVVSVSDQDEPAYSKRVTQALRARCELSRRGRWHGEWAELAPESLSPELRPPPAEIGLFSARWRAARPIVLPGIANLALGEQRAAIARSTTLDLALAETGGLRNLVRAALGAGASTFAIVPRAEQALDPERDIERVSVSSAPPGGRGRTVDDLWLKSAWLSTSDEDASLRVRVSFGRERDDDASTDLLRQRLVATLATLVFPESRAIREHATLVPLIETLCGERLLLTQDIAYWNTPEGGALFHHDAFSDDELSVGGSGQLGVCYVQLSGRTAWLALSTQDLALRVQEFITNLAEGAASWVRAQLFGEPAAWRSIVRLCEDRPALERELALPGCGELGALVNRGPEFTAYLADAGHAYVLSAGDAIVLPNHGLTCTAMHSVFCAGPDTAYSLSLAIRPDRELVQDNPAEPA